MTYRSIVVEEQDNPTTAFFILPALQSREFVVERRSFSECPAPGELDGALVVLARYVPPGWRAMLERERSQLGGLVFFMDDDVLDPAASRGTPWRYRFKLWRLAARHKAWLRRMEVQLWASTPYLCHKYADWSPRLILPAPMREPSEDARRIFYHGTASHLPELRWLRPLMASLLARDACVHFELVGKGRVARWYRGMPRVTIVQPMPWPAYQTFACLQGRHVGLAPQLDQPFNKARSYTKFFDITRSGAVGVYAENSSCAQVVRHGVEGLVVPMTYSAWEEAIFRLTHDEAGRRVMLEAAQRKAHLLAGLARKNYGGRVKHG